MPRRSNNLSAFAESAYANARETSSSLDDENDLFHYRDETVMNNNNINNHPVAHAVFQSLDGTSVVIITNTDSSSDDIKLKMKMQQDAAMQGINVENLGGKVFFDDLDNTSITHAIWIAMNDNDDDTQLSQLTDETLAKLQTCLEKSIPVMSPAWLTKIRELVPGEHWSEVNVEEYTPNIVKLLQRAVDDIQHGGGITTSRQQNTRYNRSDSRRDDSATLSASISETFRTLVDDNPDLMEEESIRRAMELSMLDFALVHHTNNTSPRQQKKKSANAKGKLLPHEILGVSVDATKEEIKLAYRRRALETHPDKEGKPGEFEAVASAYRVLLNPHYDGSLSSVPADRSDGQSLKTTAHWDNELKDHRNLVRELYQSHSGDIDANMQRQSFTLERLGLRFKEAGSRIHNEKNELICNACFYISLASSYLSGIGALSVWGSDDIANNRDNVLLNEADNELIMSYALELKRTIEAAVLSSHPEWAARGIVGEEVQAFSDFLVYALESKTIVSDWAIVVFDKCSGFVDVYRGKNYQDETDSQSNSLQTSNTLTIQYIPGHYQPLVAASYDSSRPSLKQILSCLDEAGVLYVVTDGSA